MTPGFYNENMNRNFPFVLNSTGAEVTGPLSLANLPFTAIVDAGFVASARSGYDPALHDVYFTKLRRLGTTFFFDFTSDAPLLAGVTLTFRRDLSDPNYSVEFVDSADEAPTSVTGSLSSDPGHTCDEPLISGYLVTGNLLDLDAFLSIDGSVSGQATIEPALVQSLAGAYVQSIVLANADRTRVTAPDDCPPQVWPYDTGVIFVQPGCLTGDVVFVPGYNLDLRQDDQTNTITLAPGVGAGAGQPCDEVKLFPGEIPPTDSNLLEGGPQCGEVLRTINGVGGRLFRLEAGPGVTITPIPETSTIHIAIDMHGLVVCAFSNVSESL